MIILRTLVGLGILLSPLPLYLLDGQPSERAWFLLAVGATYYIGTSVNAAVLQFYRILGLVMREAVKTAKR